MATRKVFATVILNVSNVQVNIQLPKKEFFPLK